ncbi:hypothetical protein LCGC14_1906370 [marine sediment metagenome]|uniref:Uncharacterized protein n=1 Tax=marine sediment metagenome TaxID=412755 RepID=A0A0F9FVG2_9ZZZZ
MTASTFAVQFLFVLGALDAFDITFVGTNADGTDNQAARDTALTTMLDAGIASGALVPFPGMVSEQFKNFAGGILFTIVKWKAATDRPTLP